MTFPQKGNYGADSTETTSGISFFSIFSIPFFSVICDMGQPAQAPCKRTVTIPS